MHLSKEDIENTEKIRRLNIINSLSGIKSANLIATQSTKGNTNVAIFNSVLHLGSHPALLGFVLRPNREVPRHTYENILETGFYTINHVHYSFIRQAHYTSAKFDKSISEFEKCQLTQEYLDKFPAPYVKESCIKMGMHYIESIPISINQTIMVIGSIAHIYLPDNSIDDHGHIDLAKMGSVGVSGLNTYYNLEKNQLLPYAKAEKLPIF